MRAVEATLVNDGYRETMARLDPSSGDAAAGDGGFIAEATRWHYDMHGAAAAFRGAALAETLAAALDALPDERAAGFRVLELESVSAFLREQAAG